MDSYSLPSPCCCELCNRRVGHYGGGRARGTHPPPPKLASVSGLCCVCAVRVLCRCCAGAVPVLCSLLLCRHRRHFLEDVASKQAKQAKERETVRLVTTSDRIASTRQQSAAPNMQQSQHGNQVVYTSHGACGVAWRREPRKKRSFFLFWE